MEKRKTNPKCIYCLKEKTSKEFNREHVISESLGTFTNTLVLHYVVCAACNTSLSALETEFLEDSPEGFFAAAYRVDGSKKSYPFRGERFKYNAVANDKLGIFSEVFPHIDMETGLSNFSRQVLLKGANGRKRVLTPKALDGEKAAERTRWTGSNESMFVFDESDSELNEQIGRLRNHVTYNEKEREHLGESDPTSRLIYDFDMSIDAAAVRVPAKIAFNYFAYCAKKDGKLDLLFKPEFDELRRFVLNGDLPHPLQGLVAGIQMDGRWAEKGSPLHFLAFTLQNGMIFAEVSLFALHRYVLRIGKLPTGTTEQGFGNAHLFFLDDRRYCQVSLKPDAGKASVPFGLNCFLD